MHMISVIVRVPAKRVSQNSQPLYADIDTAASAIIASQMAFRHKRLLILISLLPISVYRPCDLCTVPGQSINASAIDATAFPMREHTQYVLFAQRDQISRLDVATHQVESLRIVPLHNVDAIEFDVRRNCVFWTEKDYSIIARKCLDGQQKREILAKVDVKDVTALAYDWLSQVLFFINGGRRTIDAINAATCASASKTRMQRTIVRADQHTEIFTLAVHPAHGYLFWSEKYAYTGDTIVRSNLDGSNIWELVRLPDAYHPYVITIDSAEERIYFMDDLRGYIGRCSFEGEACEKVIYDDDEQYYFTSRHMVAHGRHVYWYDWMDRSIRRARKEKNAVGKAIRRNVFEVSGLKVVMRDLQSGENACSRGTHNCSHICVGAPDEQHSCLCPDGMSMTASGRCYCTDSDNDEDCSTFKRKCAPGQFQCRLHGKCIDA